MALEEKMNNVKYQGRDDYRVVYFDVDKETGNVKYFFLNEGKERLNNGNIIATTNLKVAINANSPEDEAMIGVVDQEGQEIIPFNNRRIKNITEDLLLVEPDKPVSENVINAINDRSQPQEATRLVSAANTIKEKVNSSMGAGGRFIFNDLFSEATIYDINGNNMVNGEYYSFIGMNDNKLFLSKNNPEMEVVTLPVKEQEVVEETQEEVVSEETAEPVDVSEVKVEENVVEDAFNNEVNNLVNFTPEESINEETPAEETSETVGEAVQSDEVQEEVVSEEVPAEEAVEEAQQEVDLNIPQDEEEESYSLNQVKVDSIDDYENFDNLTEENHFNDSDIAEGTVILEELINGIRDRDREISKLKSQVADQRDLNKVIVKKSKDLEDKVTDLSRDNTRLEEVSSYYKRAATTLAEENHNLKSQLEDKDKLLDMLKEAKRLLNGDEPKYDFDDENNFRMIA